MTAHWMMYAWDSRFARWWERRPAGPFTGAGRWRARAAAGLAKLITAEHSISRFWWGMRDEEEA